MRTRSRSSNVHSFPWSTPFSFFVLSNCSLLLCFNVIEVLFVVHILHEVILTMIALVYSLLTISHRLHLPCRRCIHWLFASSTHTNIRCNTKIFIHILVCDCVSRSTLPNTHFKFTLVFVTSYPRLSRAYLISVDRGDLSSILPSFSTLRIVTGKHNHTRVCE